MSTALSLSDHFQQTTPLWSSDLLWLKEQRLEAKRQLADLSHYRGESYRYSRLLKLMDFSWHYQPIETSANTFIKPMHPEHYTLMFINGIFSPESSTLPTAASIQSHCLTDLSEHFPAWLKTRWNTKPTVWSEQVNLLLAQQGIIIDIPAHCKLDKPIDIIHIYNHTLPTTTHTRHAIRIQAHAQVDIHEYHIATGEVDTFASNALLLELENHAKVKYHCIRHGHAKWNQLNFTQLYLGKHSELQGFLADFSSGLLRTDLNADLLEQGASLQLNAIFLGREREQIENQWHIRHIGSHTQSQCLIKGIADNLAQGICRGRVEVLPTAIKTKASLYNRNLLLHSGAQIDSLPELVILQDDVQCVHGSTVGQLDANALFYLQSRGLSLDAAKHLLTTAFIRDQLVNLPDEIRHYLFKHLPLTALEQNPERGLLV